MSAITTHVLDTARGKPAAGVPVALELHDGTSWRPIGNGVTDSDGRLRTLTSDDTILMTGTYRLIFDTAAYFTACETDALYPRVVVEFAVSGGELHYHLPLLLGPFGYTTYRGT